jgi:hypothetical protein
MLQNAYPNRIPPASLLKVKIKVNIIAKVTGSLDTKDEKPLVNKEIN